ncbi:MAG: hypothetical protein Q4D82_05995 [Neisseria sp.]|nr:hypothetical protein [Neisseria sp.]
MHYFSLHSEAGAHLGFLVMLPNDERAARSAQSGRFVVKLQEGAEHPALEALSALQNPDGSQTWEVANERVQLYAGGSPAGEIRQEFFRIDGHTLVLNDMTGMV